MLADQMIGRIEYVHVKNFIHRDIKVGLRIFFLIQVKRKWWFSLIFTNYGRSKNRNQIRPKK